MADANDRADGGAITVLIVDDSLVFRRFLRDIFEDCRDLVIVGEAQNGIEALDMILKTNPAVILLDLEMPLMDGMTALQHLMIHRPTPTIMFSSLSEEGTARAFDTMKNGAVDFISKDFVFQKNSIETERKVLLEKVRRAATLRLRAREPFFTAPNLEGHLAPEEVGRMVFCEECGGRQMVSYTRAHPPQSVVCQQCGDTIDLDGGAGGQLRRNSFITVFGGGEGSFFNLLEIVPHLDPEMGGAFLAVIHEETEHLNRFTEYLDAISAIKVHRAREGVCIEGGNCYIASGHDFLHLKPYSAQLTLQRLQKSTMNCGPLDVLLASVSTLYKKRACGVVLSGDDADGDKGMAILAKNGGVPLVLDSRECYCKKMIRHIVTKGGDLPSLDSAALVEKLYDLHSRARGGAVAE